MGIVFLTYIYLAYFDLFQKELEVVKYRYNNSCSLGIMRIKLTYKKVSCKVQKSFRKEALSHEKHI